MRAVLAIARHDLRQTMASRSALLWMFVFPVLFAAFFGVVMRGGDDPGQAKARLTVVDEDGGPLAALLLRELAGAQLEVVPMSAAEAAEAEDKIRTLYIPERFGARIAAGERVTLRLVEDRGSDGRATLAVQARVFRALARLVGSLVEAAEGSAGGSLDEQRFASYEPPPDLVTVAASFAGSARVVPSGFAQSAPGNAVMFLLLVSLTWGSAALASERRNGLLRRLAAGPVGPGEIVGGKIAGRFLVTLVQAVVLLGVAAAAIALLGLPLSGNPLAVLAVLAAFAFAAAPLGVLLGAAIEEPSRAANAGVLLTLVLASLGGCWWPLEVVPPWMQTLGRMLPTGWAMTALQRLIAFGGGFFDTIPWLAALLGLGAVASALARRLLKIA